MKVFLSAIAALIFIANSALINTAFAETQTVCAGSVPSGWIKTDDRWDPTKCGNPTNITYNVWTIEKYVDKPKGAVIVACSDSPPWGWSIIAQNWEPSKCGKPQAISNNVMTIKRLNVDSVREKRSGNITIITAPGPLQVQNGTVWLGTIADPIAAYVKERNVTAFEDKGISSHLVRFVADFNNDGFMDVAITVWPFLIGVPEWYLYLQDSKGMYVRAENIYFHPLFISIQPLTNGAKIITTTSSSGLNETNIVERIMVGREMLPSNQHHDKSESNDLFGNLHENPVSEYCPTPDYFKNACRWEKGYR
jgi:hypothetical protein